jgi:hypothetical protein
MYAHARTYPLSSPSLRRSVPPRRRRDFFSPLATQHLDSAPIGVEAARALLAIANAVLWALLLWLI